MGIPTIAVMTIINIWTIRYGIISDCFWNWTPIMRRMQVPPKTIALPVKWIIYQTVKWKLKKPPMDLRKSWMQYFQNLNIAIIIKKGKKRDFCRYRNVFFELGEFLPSYTLHSMTSLLLHTVAQPTKWRFLPKNSSQLIIFVIGLVFTWVWGDKNHQNLIFKVNFLCQKSVLLFWYLFLLKLLD